MVNWPIVGVGDDGPRKPSETTGKPLALAMGHLTIIHDADGYAYSLGETIVIRAEPGPDLLPPTAQAGGPRKS